MKKTVLLVDDFENTLFITTFSLKNDYDVVQAKSAKEALNILNNQIPDLIITDYNMPEMNGYEFVKAIRKNPAFVKIPIFVLSTETSVEKKDQMYKLGVTAWVQKPFRIEMLKVLIQKAIK
jgi:CheY-like chemotaxis protein